MKKVIALLLALVTLLSLTACAGKEDAASSALDQIKQKGELVVGTSADYPPYEFHTEVDGKDTIVGFDMEIAQAIADKLGVPLKIVDMSFDNLLMSLANDEFDLVIAGLTADEERRKTTDFSDPYLEAKNLILVRAEDADKYASLDDLKGVKGGAQTGSRAGWRLSISRRPAPSPITTALPTAVRRPRSALPRYRIWSWSWRPESWMSYFWTT